MCNLFSKVVKFTISVLKFICYLTYLSNCLIYLIEIREVDPIMQMYIYIYICYFIFVSDIHPMSNRWDYTTNFSPVSCWQYRNSCLCVHVSNPLSPVLLQKCNIRSGGGASRRWKGQSAPLENLSVPLQTLCMHEITYFYLIVLIFFFAK